jgi:hypothetical protein
MFCRTLFGCLGRFPVSLWRLYYQTHLDGLGGDVDTRNLAVNDSPNLLDVRFELSFAYAADIETNTALAFWFTASYYAAAGRRSSTCKMTYS